MKSQDENNAHEKDGTKLVVVSVKVGLTGLSPSLLHCCCSLSSLNQASQNKIQSLELIIYSHETEYYPNLAQFMATLKLGMKQGLQRRLNLHLLKIRTRQLLKHYTQFDSLYYGYTQIGDKKGIAKWVKLA
jgi:hypothetical protein